jgi:AsmA-like protein
VELDTHLAAPPNAPLKRRPWRKRPLFWILVSAAAIFAVIAAMFTAVMPLSSDTVRERIVRALSDKLDSDVELGELQLRVFPVVRIEGANLTIRRHGSSDAYPPLIAVKSFHVDASIAGVARKHVDHVQLTGLTINIAPKPERRREHEIEAREQHETPVATIGTTQSAAEKLNDPLKDSGVVLDRVDTANARLIIIPEERDKAPKEWAIHTLTMYELGALHSWPFQAVLTNAVPPGEIAVKGDFGPWNRVEPGDTPLDGRFNFADADLSVFKGISGTLSSKGSFAGTLDEIRADGETDTPDFTIKVGGHPFALHTKYQALIDGTNGNTRLEKIDASFLKSHLIAKGAVLDAPKNQHGRTVQLDVNMDSARIEDVMTMAVPTPKPPMTGALRLNTRFLLPPGDTDVSQRLRLDGHFAIARAHFTSYDIQAKINELSKRGRGKVEDVKNENVVSDFQGRFKLGGGSLDLPDLTFAVPGAKVELAGSYALRPQTLAFKGQLLIDAMVSDTVTGWKKWLMKPADTIFKRSDGNGSAIPIQINGTRSEPKFGLDVRTVFKRRG